MKKYIAPALFLALAVLVLTACPYTSRVPISATSEKLDKKLFGKWVKASDYDEEHPEFFEISEHQKFQYQIAKNEYNSTDSVYDKTIYVSHTTTLGEYMFINMQKDGEGDYYLYRIVLNEDKSDFTLFEVTDNIDEKYNNSADLKAFVDKYKALSFFYNSDEKKYVKQK